MTKMTGAEKQKAVISFEHATNRYCGNYIDNPNNALRDDEKLIIKAYDELNALKTELKDQKTTHKECLELMKARGIHARYYRYRKYVPEYCPICEKQGISSGHSSFA